MISRKLYYLPTHDIDWGIVHIYEHTVIRGFNDCISAYGHHPSLYGWIRGETFEGHVFLDTGFYSPEVARLFECYLQGEHEFIGTKALEQSILDVQAEGRSIMTIQDRERFDTVINHLSQLRWNSDNTTRATVDSSNILSIIKKSAASREVILTYGSKKFTPQEYKLFLRLYVIIGDILTDVLYDTFVCYQRNQTGVYGSEKGMGSMKKFTFARKQGSLKDIERVAKGALQSFSWCEHQKEVLQHFEVYGKEESWLSLAIEYYRDAGIITNTEEIAQLATINAIERVAAKVHVHVRPYEKEDDAYFY